MAISLNGSGGITYPDGSVNTTRSVSTAGDTMSGALNVPANASGTQVPRVSEVVRKVGDTLTGSVVSNKASFRTATSSRFALGIGDTGNYHITTTDQGGSVNTSKQHGITFQPLSSNGTQSGVIFAENSVDGTGVGIFTSQQYSSGPVLNFTVSPQGYVNKPNQPSFGVTQDLYNPPTIFSTNTTMSNGNFPSNQFTSQKTSPNFNINNGFFTAPIAGNYFVTGFFSRSAGHATIDIYKNGGAVSGGIRALSYGTDWQTVTISCVIALNTGDYLSCIIGATNATNTYGYSSGFCGYLLG